jgi:acetylornithine deacetylase/succinyl-diaminopimelate desuccinylase-like protein
VKVKIKPHHGGQAAVIATDSVAFKAASAAFLEAWGKEPIPTRDGGSIPIVALFQKELEVDSVMLGFGLNSDSIHSPNESYGLTNYFKGIETIILFYKHLNNLLQR